MCQIWVFLGSVLDINTAIKHPKMTIGDLIRDKQKNLNVFISLIQKICKKLQIISESCRRILLMSYNANELFGDDCETAFGSKIWSCKGAIQHWHL